MTQIKCWKLELPGLYCTLSKIKQKLAYANKQKLHIIIVHKQIF